MPVVEKWIQLELLWRRFTTPQGRKDEARKHFERLLSVCNDVGLLSEQYDPTAQRLLGNSPQAFSHVGLINTAHNLGGEGSD